MARTNKDDRPWKTRVRSEAAAFKGMSFKKKIEHFWTYYALDLALILAAVFIVVYLGYSVFFKTENPVIYGYFYNLSLDDDADDTMKTYLCDTLGLDEKEYDISFDFAVLESDDSEQVVAMQQTLMAMIATKEMDFLCADLETFSGITDPESEDDFLTLDLSEFLDEETYERLVSEGRILTIETEHSGTVPYLIDISDSELADMIGLTGGESYLGVFWSVQHPDAVKAMIDLIR